METVRRGLPVKYVADYHVFDYSSKGEIVKMLSLKKPRFIVITPEAKPFLEIIGFLRQNYFLTNSIDDAEIWSLKK